jgi:type II secretory pathway component PulK
MILHRATSRGSVLLLALWALVVLSMAVFAWVKMLDQRITLDTEANLAFEARALARSGVSVAMHPLTSPRTPALRREIAPDRRYEATMESEGGKLNLNWLLAGEDPVKLTLLENYLAHQGYALGEAADFVDCMLDWIDGDTLKRLNGAEDDGDYKAANRPFESVDELARVKGSDRLKAKPRWREDFTVNSRGPIDLNHVSARILGLVPNIGEVRAANFVRYRQGPDREDYTEDDHEFKTGDEMVSTLGFSRKQFETLSGLLSTRPDSAWEVVSVGYAGKVHRQVRAVVKKQANNMQIVSWKDL